MIRYCAITLCDTFPLLFVVFWFGRIILFSLHSREHSSRKGTSEVWLQKGGCQNTRRAHCPAFGLFGAQWGDSEGPVGCRSQGEDKRYSGPLPSTCKDTLKLLTSYFYWDLIQSYFLPLFLYFLKIFFEMHATLHCNIFFVLLKFLAFCFSMCVDKIKPC